MQITNFSISADRTQMDVTITDAATVSSLRFWTQSTYKDYSQSIDLTSKLSGLTTENIIITLSDVSLSYFDGVYFLEAEDPDEISGAITSDLTRYKECILEKLMLYSVCEDCLEKDSARLINAQALLNGLESAIEQGFIDEILSIVAALDKFCSNDCKSCGERKNVVNTNYYTTNN